MPLNKFVPMSKVEMQADGTCKVWGWAAEEAPDQTKEIMDYVASKPHFLKWSERIRKATGGKSLGNVRAMHAKIAAGKVIEFDPRDDLKKFWVGTHIIDPIEVKKTVEGVYSGFSVGGDYGKTWPDPQKPGFIRYEAIPNEISLADNPCMVGAVFEFVKASGAREMRKIAGPGTLGKSVSLEERASRIRQAWNNTFNPDSQNQAAWLSDVWVRDVLDDRVIVQRSDGMWAYAYTESADGAVSFIGEPVKVELEYLPVDAVAKSAAATLAKKGKHSYPWDECIRDQEARYGSEETARKVCGMIRHKYGKVAKVEGEPDPDIEYEGDLDEILRDIESKLGIKPVQKREGEEAMSKRKKSKKPDRRPAVRKVESPSSDPELEKNLAEVEQVLNDTEQQLEAAAEYLQEAADAAPDAETQEQLESAAEGVQAAAEQTAESATGVQAASEQVEQRAEERTTDTQTEPGEEAGEDDSEETMSEEAEEDAEAPDEGAEDTTEEPAQRLTADDVRAIVVGLLEELGIVQRLSAAASAGDLRKSVKSVSKALGKAARASDLKKVAGDVARVALAVEEVLERLRKIEQPGQGPVLREINLFGSGNALGDMSDVDVLEEMLTKVQDPAARQVIGQKLTELRIRSTHAAGGHHISPFNSGGTG